MTAAVPAWRIALRLGRVSNLPTVWSNVLAATALSGAEIAAARTAAVALAMSLLYVGGMYLNDAFDREIDARERPERPIPSGIVSARAVFAAGFGLLAAGLALLGAIALASGSALPLLGGALLAAAIVYYDAVHKGSRWSPVVMGLCRALVYWTGAAAAAGSVSGRVLWAAGLLWAYVIGLTTAAAQENQSRLRSAWPLVLLVAPFAYALPRALGAGALALGYCAVFLAWVLAARRRLIRPESPDLRGGISRLIAGIALFDALFCALAGAALPALLCLGAAVLTLRLQRHVPGT